MKLTAALESWMVFQDTAGGGLAWGEICAALSQLFGTLAQASVCLVSFFQINASFLNTLLRVPWPDAFISLAKLCAAFNLDFLDPDAFAQWTGRSLHYASVTIALCVAYLVRRPPRIPTALSSGAGAGLAKLKFHGRPLFQSNYNP